MEYCIQSLNVYFTYLKLFFLKVPPLLLVSFDPQFLISSDDQIMPPPLSNEPGQAASEMQEIYYLINISPPPPPPKKRKGSLISDPQCWFSRKPCWGYIN